MFAKKIAFGLVLSLSLTSVFGQIGVKPLLSNSTIQTFLHDHPDYEWNQTKSHGKWGTPDTLQIPFFDDFTSTVIYPDSSHWSDNQVFVNRDFGINPPSYGVATFDYLDENGLPYSSIEKESIDFGDTLTSQFVNLADSMGSTLDASDSVYFSFFYQARGRGDFITENDSLKLLFLDNTGVWRRVWGVRGGTDYNFNQVLIPIVDSRFFHVGFKFRFTNITHRWGNNNHWHVDYVYLNTNRNASDEFYRDYAIQSPPTSLLKNFYSMPYDHFLADPSEAADSIFFNVSNLNDKVINAEVKHLESHQASTLVSTNYADNAANVPSQGWARRRLKGYNFTGLSGYPVTINRNYFIQESGIVNPVLFQGNDVISVEQNFTRHYAYDDGTAESGFGFNDLKADEGKIVVEYDLKKRDTLWAVDIMITYNTQDISRQRFDFQIWSDIAFGAGSDELIYEQSFGVGTIYDGTENRGFYTIRLDTPIVLDPGKFYVGWSQDNEYNLTVGFDKNNGYLANSGQANQHIYFNIGDGWLQNDNDALSGAPMIRPIVGQESPFSVSVEEVKKQSFNLYPNPTESVIHLPENTTSVSITDLQGREMAIEKYQSSPLDVSHFPAGIYTVRILTKQNERLTAKLIKL